MSTDRSIVQSFKSRDFKPPFLFSNNHFQTLVGSGAIKQKIFGHIDRPFKTHTERIDTPDGDFFDVEFSDNFEQSETLVLLLHGLESNKKSNTITNFANAFIEKGHGCCLISFRACNGEDNRSDN
jgi:predicted alpha/beta-fold hydrolase